MKICENCGAESPDDANICLICGHELPNSSSQDFTPNNNNLDFNNMNNPSPNQNTREALNICSKCGKENPPGAKFCIHCGAPMESNTNFNQEQQQNQGQGFNNQQQYQNNQYNNQQYQNQEYQNNQQYQNQYNNQQFQNQYGNQQFQQNPMYHPNHSFYNPDKSVGLATFLSFIIIALGQAYLGLYKRFAFEFLIGFLLGLLTNLIADYTGTSDTDLVILLAVFIIYVVWVVYTIYDSYKCARAVRFDTDLPLFLGRWDIE